MKEYPALKDFDDLELVQLWKEARKYEKEDPDFLKAVDIELNIRFKNLLERRKNAEI